MTDRAITPYEKLKATIKQEEIQERFRQILGQRSGAFLASVVNTVYLDENLRDCEPNSIISGAVKAAVVNLPVDKEIGHAYLVPYNTKTGKKAQFQIGYKGYIQLALRTNEYEIINVANIYQGQEVVEDQLTGVIKINGQKISDDIIGVAGYFKLKNGFEKYLYMSLEEIHAYASRYSPAYNNASMPWKTNTNDMEKKTVIKQLLKKWGKLSIELQRVIEEEEVEEAPPLPTEPEGEIIDALFKNPPDLEDDPLLVDEPQIDRPYEPLFLMMWLADLSENSHGDVDSVTKNQRALFRYCFELALIGQPEQTIKDKQYTVSEYLFGEKSSNKVSPPYIKTALEDWFEVAQEGNGSGDYHINPACAMEIEAVYIAATQGEGQQSLDLEGGE